jgi:hypothetical protein
VVRRGAGGELLAEKTPTRPMPAELQKIVEEMK